MILISVMLTYKLNIFFQIVVEKHKLAGTSLDSITTKEDVVLKDEIQSPPPSIGKLYEFILLFIYF